MPSGEGRMSCLRCARHSRVDFQVKPYAKWSREAQSFVTQMYLTISYSSWKKTGCFGVTQKGWGTNGQRTCTGLQRESAVEGKSSSTEGSLSSQNTKLISPIVIPQMIENKSKENGPTLPMQSLTPQPSAYQTKQPLSNHGSVNINRKLTELPSRLEIQTSLDDTTPPSDSPTTEGNQCPNQQKGFSSITITARRVAGGSGDPARGPRTGQEPNTVSPTLTKVPAVLQRWPPLDHANQSATPLKISESCLQLSKEPQKQLFNPGNKEKSVGLQSSDGREKVPPSFISHVHLQVSQQGPSTIYYVDKSLNVCVDQPRIECQQIHRSALSFKINCSSSRLTADGADGIANGEPIEELLKTKLLGANKTPLRSNWSADLTENNVINKETTTKAYLGSKHLLQSVFASELPAIVDIPRGPNNVGTTKKDDAKQPGSYHTTFSLWLPNSSKAGTQMLPGNKKKQHTVDKSSATTSGALPDTASRNAIAAATDGSLKKIDPSKGTSKPKDIQAQGIILKAKKSLSDSMCYVKASSRILVEEYVHRQNQLLKISGARSPDVTREKNDTLAQPESGTQPEEIPPAPRTLREALEIHKPQFISRSQERLKQLEQKVQLRKAQQSDAPASTQGPLLRKLSSTSTSSRKKQYTIPDPLS
ncbi:PREDICTED: centrosomal protein C10orf90-like, partial [Pterocles gutturalis]|uniref:centrosomal protein C10orf90-like n=1 Tax=Pterocles gutturalis TaxID=240206 RepID=UPI0005284D53